MVMGRIKPEPVFHGSEVFGLFSPGGISGGGEPGLAVTIATTIKIAVNLSCSIFLLV